MTELLNCVTCDAPGPHTATVIWLHGLGADGNDFPPALPMLGLPPTHGVRFVFPNAPSIPVSLNNGFVMPAWYDISGMDLERKHDEPGIRRSEQQVNAIIAAEATRLGGSTNQIALVGFSQGGAMAYHCGVRYPTQLAGIAGLSTYLVLPETLLEERSEANQETPMFAAHGSQDPMVPIARGKAAQEALIKAGYKVSWESYPMQHAVCAEELLALGAFFARTLQTAAGSVSPG